MAEPTETAPPQEARPEQDELEMPRPTAAPLVLALGLILLAAGVALGLVFLAVGALVALTGLSMWVAELLPGRGHAREPLVPLEQRPKAITAELAQVEQLRPGLPGYRIRLPEAVHPLSAGIKGGIIGGLVMPLPAFLYGLLSGHAAEEFLGCVWYPVNLLAGMVLPGVGAMTDRQLEQFSLSLLIVGIVIHATICVVFGLLYGVLLPMLPNIRVLPIPAAFVWGGVVFPLLWTGVSYSLMGVANPALQERVDWPWFILSQFVFGAVAAFVVARSEKVPVQPAGSGPG